MIKKLLFTVFVAFIAASASAQFKAGDQFIGPTLSFGSSKTENGSTQSKANNFNASIDFVSFTTARKAWGARVGYSGSKIEYRQPSSEQNTNGMMANVFLKNYVGFYQKFYAAVEYGVGYRQSFNKTTSLGFESKSTTNGAMVYLSPSIGARLNKRLLLEASLANFAALSYEKTKPSGSNAGSTTETFGFYSSTSLGNFFSNVGLGLKIQLN